MALLHGRTAEEQEDFARTLLEDFQLLARRRDEKYLEGLFLPLLKNVRHSLVAFHCVQLASGSPGLPESSGDQPALSETAHTEDT